VTVHVETMLAFCFFAFVAGMLLVFFMRDERRRKLERQVAESRRDIQRWRHAAEREELAAVESRAKFELLSMGVKVSP
jgi:hypothetical protein